MLRPVIEALQARGAEDQVTATFEGRLGAVDARLVAEARLRKLDRAADLELAKRPPSDGDRIRRDPAVLVDLLCVPLGQPTMSRR